MSETPAGYVADRDPGDETRHAADLWDKFWIVVARRYLTDLEAVRRAGDDLMDCLAEFGPGTVDSCAERYQVLGDALAAFDPGPRSRDHPARPAPDPGLVEHLAAIEHERWADWQRYLHARCQRQEDGSLTIPADLVARWERQIATPYADLSEPEKQSDRDQVARYWHLVRDAAASAPPDRPEWAAIEEVARRLYHAHQTRGEARGGYWVHGGTDAYVRALLAAREAMLALGEALERPSAPVDAADIGFTVVVGAPLAAVMLERDDGTEGTEQEPEEEGDDG